LFLIQPDSPVDDGIVKNMRFMPGSIEALVLLLGLSQCADNDFGEGGQEVNQPPELFLLIGCFRIYARLPSIEIPDLISLARPQRWLNRADVLCRLAGIE
jgi:hypothetical protein